MIRCIRLLPVLACLVLAGAWQSAFAADIKVLVNGEPITSYDIAQRVAMQKISGQRASNSAAVEELINEAVQLSEARRRGITVPQPQIDAAFASIATQVKMTPAQFTRALAGAGVNADSLKNRIRAQIAWGQLMQGRMQRAAVNRQDITNELLARGDAAQTMKEYTLQQIIFVAPKGSSAGVYAQRRREAESFRQRFRGCDNALQQARGLRNVVVRDLGRRDTTQLGGAQGEEIGKTRTGSATRPRQTDQGIELVAVCAVREVRSNAAARAEIENRLLVAQSETVGKEYLDELRGKAIIERR